MEIDLKKINNVHFLGIGGIGVSAIARMMKGERKRVTGIDPSQSEVTDALVREGVDVSIEPNSSVIPPGTELVVYTRALEVADAHILDEVRAQGVPVLSYPEVLHIISSHKYTIAVSGTHGKTTTTAMIGEMLLDAGKDPTIVVGSMMAKTGTNFVAGASDYFVVEADEYRRSFLNLEPRVLVITNIEADHLDYYRDLDDVKDAFRSLALKVPLNGAIVCDASDPVVRDVVVGAGATVIDYRPFMDAVPVLGTPGEHNRKNAACALAIAAYLGIDQTSVNASLSAFRGTWRRFEYIGETEKGALVYDDYAHHPTEVRATLQAAKKLFPEKRIIVLFHPHLYSRTKLLFEDFAAAFAESGVMLMLLPIYPAREAFDPSISSDMLAERVVSLGGSAVSYPDFASAEANVREMAGSDDVIITMGAGEANKIAYSLGKR